MGSVGLEVAAVTVYRKYEGEDGIAMCVGVTGSHQKHQRLAGRKTFSQRKTRALER